MAPPMGELLVAALDSLPFPVLSVDRDGVLLFVNRAAAANLSSTRDAVLGTSLFDHFDEAAAVAARERIRQTIKAGTVQRFEAVVTLPDGSERQFASLYCPAFDQAGELVAVQIASREVPAEDSSAAAPRAWDTVSDDLSMTRSRLNAILENAPMLLAVYGPDAVTRYVSRLDPSVDRADVIGKSPFAWVVEDDRETFQRTFDEALQARRVADCEVRGVSGRSWLVRLAPLVDGDEVKQVVACILDVTEQRRLQAELAHRQRIESLGTMARGIAHDFNNLLTAILGNATLGRRRAAAGRDTGKLFDDIETAARRAASLCEQMLVYSGRNPTSSEPADVNEVIAEMTPLTRAAVGAKIEVFHDLGAEVPAVRCNPAQLGQVVLNLINNAADAIGGAGGRIEISTRAMEIAGPAPGYLPRPPQPGRYVHLAVADDGPGIPDETRHRLFDPFYTTKETGHGLGLSVVLGILSSRGGAIAVDCPPGGGTRVDVLLPVHDRPAGARPASSGDASWPRGEGVVLVVDDEPAVRGLLANLLSEAGYEVLLAPHGGAALEILGRGAPIRAVILDVTMPVLDGFAVLDQLRVTHPELPVWLSSGKPIDRASDDRFLRVLAKPYAPDQVLRELAAVLGRGGAVLG